MWVLALHFLSSTRSSEKPFLFIEEKVFLRFLPDQAFIDCRAGWRMPEISRRLDSIVSGHHKCFKSFEGSDSKTVQDTPLLTGVPGVYRMPQPWRIFFAKESCITLRRRHSTNDDKSQQRTTNSRGAMTDTKIVDSSLLESKQAQVFRTCPLHLHVLTVERFSSSVGDAHSVTSSGPCENMNLGFLKLTG